MKYSKQIGLIACLILIVACFLPWTYYPYANETFSGFHVKRFPNGIYYGKPGVFITIMAIAVAILTYIPKLWAKRTNVFVAALLFAYIIRTFFIFIGSVVEGDVEKKPGIFIVLIAGLIVLLSTFFPDLKIKSQDK